MKRLYTVKELITELSKFSSETTLTTFGADCGGYDVVPEDYCCIYPSADFSSIALTHKDYDENKTY